MTLAEKWPRARAAAIRTTIQNMDLCGCGTDTAWECVREVLEEAEHHSREGFYRYKWLEFGAHILDGKALLEHGSGIGFAWLTDAGRELLEFLREFGTCGACFPNDDAGTHPLWTIDLGWSADVEKPDDAYSEWARSAGATLSVSNPLATAKPAEADETKNNVIP